MEEGLEEFITYTYIRREILKEGLSGYSSPIRITITTN